MEEVIAAVATAWGESGISIVRVSGFGSVEIAEKVFKSRRPLSACPPRYLALGYLVSLTGEKFDEALAVRFEKNSSYTAEESVELQCHGGITAASKCLECLCSYGARIAKPGEFTRRAFTNGRIDLSQAESVLGIIKAKSEEALSASARTLQGELSSKINSLLSKLTSVTAKFEVQLDFPEEDTEHSSFDDKMSAICGLLTDTENLLERCRLGMAMREGVKAAIIGKPNVGKSSLLNAFLGEQRAIVTHVPGTTRDTIEETVIYKGIPIRFVDTAGIRSTKDEVESIGVERAYKLIEQADVLLFVIDASSTAGLEDYDILKAIEGRRYITVFNKADLPSFDNKELISKISNSSDVVAVSAKCGTGIDSVKELLVKDFNLAKTLDGGLGVSSRQMNALQTAYIALSQAKDAAMLSLGEDAFVSCLADARFPLSEITGADASEDLLDSIFRDFCVGK